MFSDDIAIRVSNLSKCYQIYNTPRDRLKQFVLPRVQRAAGMSANQYYREFWALKNVNFEVKKGETVGIVGCNGSGKSTLLQMICGTLTPTSGNIQTNGRIAALLELGSGFNPEFTGRENVYMNAKVLGLSTAEVDARFDAIVAFADIGEFIEQPVKTYSSGMYVRLAFAVIAHVDADILVVDEALSVGDAVFTQKCMRFIRKFQEHGALLFVSHDTASVQNLCQRGIWLSNGLIEQHGTAKSVSEAYLHYTQQAICGNNETLVSIDPTSTSAEAITKEADTSMTALPLIDYGAVTTVRENINFSKGWETGKAKLVSASFSRLTPGPEKHFMGGERIIVTLRAKAFVALESPILGFIVKDRLGQDLFGENTLPFTDLSPRSIQAGQEFTGEFVFTLPMLPDGQYLMMASVADGNLVTNVQHNYLHDAVIINVSSSKVRWGLVGIPFEKISLNICDDK